MVKQEASRQSVGGRWSVVDGGRWLMVVGGAWCVKCVVWLVNGEHGEKREENEGLSVTRYFV